jgi:hypothetical protein
LPWQIVVIEEGATLYATRHGQRADKAPSTIPPAVEAFDDFFFNSLLVGAPR